MASCPSGADGAAWLGEWYVDALPASVRSRGGRYYTPRPLAKRLVEEAWAIGPAVSRGLVVDPACGGGALLAAAAERAVAERPADEAIAWVHDHLRGTDIDPMAVWLCNLAVRAVLLPAWSEFPNRARPSLPLVARCEDGLADQQPASLVLTNPPFGRVQLSPDDRRRYAQALFGHANRATLFLHDAVCRLDRSGAAAAFVLPASIVGGAYSQRLRSMLADEAPPAWLAFVRERDGVFPGEVLQESVLGVFVKGRPLAPVACERIALNGGMVRRSLGHTAISARGDEPWLLPRSPEDAELISRATGYTGRLVDYGWTVSTGPLVWNRHREALFTEPGSGRVPVIWAQDVRDGRIRASERRPARWCEPDSGQAWLILDAPAVLVQRTTAPEQARRIVAGYLDEKALEALGGQVVVENHLNVCRWNGTGPVNPERLVRFLASETADRLYRCMSGSVAVSAFELRTLPMPPPRAWREERFPMGPG